MRKLLVLLLVLISVTLISCNEPTDTSAPESIEISKDSVEIEELHVIVGDNFTLSCLGVDASMISWSSSDSSIVNVNSNGQAIVLSKGMVVITATVKNAPYITDSIYVKATEKVQQTGVGSGLSQDDPLFLGNEGEDEPIEVYFFEMQHIYADSVFIKKGNVEVLIDAGWAYDGEYINKLLTQYCADDRLDLLMASHSDGDHIDGISEALNGIDNISMMVDYGGVGTADVLAVRKTYGAKGMVYHSAYDSVNGLNGASNRYYLTEDFYVDILNTGEYITPTTTSASNPHSLAVIFHYKDFSFFTGGDITTETESKLLKNEDLPEVTLYKASHHGSNGSNSQPFLNALNPKAVAISSARANNYQDKPTGPDPNKTNNLNGVGGHPYEGAIERIYKAPNISQNLNVYWTMTNGTMKFTSYGENDFVFSGSKTVKGYYDLTLTDGVAVWNEALQDFENKVTGEENCKLHETKAFQFRGYNQYLPDWAKQ